MHHAKMDSSHAYGVQQMRMLLVMHTWDLAPGLACCLRPSILAQQTTPPKNPKGLSRKTTSKGVLDTPEQPMVLSDLG